MRLDSTCRLSAPQKVKYGPEVKSAILESAPTVRDLIYCKMYLASGLNSRGKQDANRSAQGRFVLV